MSDFKVNCPYCGEQVLEMDLALPPATELRKFVKQTKEIQHKEWIESIKQTVIDDAKFGYKSSLINDPYCGTYIKEICDIFVPLGYRVNFTSDEASNGSIKYYIEIMW